MNELVEPAGLPDSPLEIAERILTDEYPATYVDGEPSLFVDSRRLARLVLDSPALAGSTSPPLMGASPRSGKWPRVRAAWLLAHGECAFCGTTKNLNVHHIRPYHLHPELELDPENFITLCEVGNVGHINCHLVFGHWGDWRAVNPCVVDIVAMLRDAYAKKAFG